MSVLSGMKVINSNGKTPVNKPTGNKPQNTGSDDIVVTSSSLDRPDNIIFEENQNLADVQSDFNTILLVLIKNYEKINKICVDNNKPFKINSVSSAFI